ncbi:S8 family serine peptidase [Paenibacillus sp. MWE-103]|uniref:S8 family serine peptidase n=1 Tax=Paenibacillus artemisiicola TaxID=1172618 RepID=A0ABS3WGN9_9BACL|nr:S8 family serine peptidase [Paenibacillus artemisiicola]MBO7747494.1 S8 family serine peptidase [Paenibacillus artemisiicola]
MKRKATKRSVAMMLSASLALGLFPSVLNADAIPVMPSKSASPISPSGIPKLERPFESAAGSRIIVKYKDNADRARVRAASAAARFEPLSRFGMEVLDLAPGADAGSVVASLNANPDVLYAEPDVKIRKHMSLKPKPGAASLGGNAADSATGPSAPSADPLVAPSSSSDSASALQKAASEAAVSAAAPSYPDDPLFSSQWGLHNEGQSIDGSYGNYDVDVDAPEAWGVTKGSQDTIVAILDTGVDVNHPDLAANAWRNANEIPGNGVDDDGDGFIDDVYGWNFYGNNNQPYSIYDDDFYGTQIAGVLAAKDDNSAGISGVAPNIRYMPLKVMGYDGGYVSDALRAIDYAERMGAKIANISWSAETYSNALKDAIDASDMLFVASAGEDYVNLNKDDYPEYPAVYDSDNILSVAGLGMDGNFYNVYGMKSVDIAAPSAKILTTLPTRDPGIGAEIDNGTYKAIYNEMGFEGMWTGDASSIENHREGFDRALRYLGKQDGGASSILLVDDEEVPEQTDLSVLWEYESHLDAAGADYDIVKVQPGADGPSLETMDRYDIVVWFTGYGFGSSPDGRPTTVLRGADQANLTAYLNGGGRLMLSGVGALTNIESSDFVKNVLHLDFVRYDFFRGTGDISRWRAGEGQPGTIYDGQRYDISSIVFADYASNDESVTRMNLTAAMDDYDYDFGAYLAPAYASGAAALVLSQDPTLDAKAVKERVLLAGKHLETLWNEDAQGYMNNGRMVDAFRAVSDDDAPGKPLKPLQTDSLDQPSGDMQDIYYVHLNAGDKLNLSLTGDAGSNFMLTLYNPDLKSVADWDAQDKVLGSAMAAGEPATIAYQADRTGYYYVGVFFMGSSGAYTLGMNADPAHTAGTYEDNADAVAFDGPWAEKADDGYSGGTLKTVDSAGHATFAFTGSLIELTALKDDTMGIADVFVDGVKAASPSLYGKTPQAKQTVYRQSLPYGYHTIEVAWTGKSDPAAKRTVHAINVDAFVVGDGGGAYTSVAEESDNAFQYAGLWSLQTNAGYSGGRAQATDSAGAYAVFSFTGTSAALKAATTPNSGKVTIMVDDRPETAKTVDLYGEATRYQVPVFDTGTLPYGPHTLRIVNAHAKNEKSGGYGTNVDAVVVTKPAGGESLKIYQDMNPFVSYAGVWAMQLSAKNSGGSAKYSDAAGNAARLAFLGTKVTLLSQTGPNRGMVDIYIDGAKANEAPIDLYGEKLQYQVPVFESAVLPAGSHDIKVVNAGGKNARSSGHTVSIDAFYVLK